MDIKEYQNSFKKGVNILIQKQIAKLKFNYTQTGVIKTVNGDGSYVVTINGEDIVLNSRVDNTYNYAITNVVEIQVPNSKLNHRYIAGLKVFN